MVVTTKFGEKINSYLWDILYRQKKIIGSSYKYINFKIHVVVNYLQHNLHVTEFAVNLRISLKMAQKLGYQNIFEK